MKEDTRELKTFERILGDYDVAGAIYSYGDVIDFVDTPEKHNPLDNPTQFL